MILVGLAIALATLVPLFLASLVLIQELRRDYPDFVLNLRTAAAIWLGIGIGVAATALVLTRLGLAV